MSARLRTVVLAACLVTTGCGEQPQPRPGPEIHVNVRVPRPTIINREIFVPQDHSECPTAPTSSTDLPDETISKAPAAPDSEPLPEPGAVTPSAPEVTDVVAAGPTPSTSSVASLPPTSATSASGSANEMPVVALN
ncbi:MAG: hypothetical protein HYY25_02745 [Candidatus Wallbacteria bacterium]|nr:hypothetical protein [Candidatus Wallbacteria bacterium]